MGIPTVTDAALVAAVADGETGALRELYERHGAWLHARLIRRCNDPEVVVEVVQDTFVALWKDARRFRRDGEVGGVAVGHRVPAAGLAAALAQGRRAAAGVGRPGAAGTLPAAEDQVLLGVEYGDLAGALRRLSPEFRSVVQAVVLDGLTTKEAGTAARRTREHREDPAPPRQGAAARLAGRGRSRGKWR